MTSNGKLWVLRLASIPALLYLPAACLGIADWLGGSRYPTGESFMAGLVGMAIVICLLPWTVFARRNSSLKRGFRLLTAIVAFDIVGIPVVHLMFALFSPPVYDRASLRLDPIVPPTFEITGAWKGSWTDPRRDFTSIITLTITQSQNAVTGFILDDRGTQLNISEGVVSRNKLNVHCAEGFA